MNMGTVCILLALTVIHITTASILNVALGKPASMSSRFRDGYNASTAVDGKSGAGGWTPDLIIHTDTRQTFAWWEVDFERDVQDATVRIYFRTDYKTRRNGLKLYTSTNSFPLSNPTRHGQLCHTVTGDPSGSDIPDVYNVTCPGRWRYFLLYTDTANDGDGPILDFGEVEVFACSVGTYGEDCTKICSLRNCVTMTTTCSGDGRCPDGCKPGWTGMDCTRVLPPCTNNYYGLNCDKLCSDRKCKAPSTSSCDRLSGRCPGGCEDGWREEDCTQDCDSGSYGGSCRFVCTDRHCLSASSTCDHVTGQCDGGCQPGYQGLACTYACDSGFYGPGCSSSCSNRNCVEPSTECDHVTGQCLYGCTPGYRGIDCAEKCSPGMYGPGCSMSCGSCSSDEVCHHVTGSCPRGCKAGWRNEKCNEVCSEDTYGPDCTEKCVKCDGVCDSVDGRCPVGCLDGYNGTKCDVALKDASVQEPVYFSVASLAGAVVGTFIVVALLAVGIHLSLIRQGRIQWIKNSEDKKQVQESRDFTQMSSISPRQAETSEPEQSSIHVYNNDYAVLDIGTKTDNKDYDFIKPNYYENL